MQRVTDILSIWLKSRLFETLSCSIFFDPTFLVRGH